VHALGKFLNQLQTDYNRAKYLPSDPLEFVHRYQDPWDQEAVALLAAVLAYGNVKQIRKSVEDALNRIHEISDGPRSFVTSLQNPRKSKKADQVFRGFIHRFNCGADLVLLFEALNRSWIKFGSLGGHFLTHLDPEALHIEDALAALIQDWRNWTGSNMTSTFSYLLTSPSDGSCCKRWCMFLRWMGRRDEVDPGLWGPRSPLAHTFPKGRALKSSQLVMPLDTHTGRISQYLSLTSRKSLNWKAALEVTDSLKKVDPIDPVRYDFALARLGILDLCQRSYREEICKKCQLLPACHFAQNFLKKSQRHAPTFKNPY
jgi:uncharacterized protein (TIGR02757 family)